MSPVNFATLVFFHNTHKKLTENERRSAILQCVHAGAEAVSARPRKGHLEGIWGHPQTSPGYWTNGPDHGTFDHHDAGLVDVRPGQGIASRWEAPEHGPGVVVADEMGVYHSVQRVVLRAFLAESIPSR